MENVLVTDNLIKDYGDKKVLRGCSIRVPEGSICGLVGRNGAGKTTLFRVVCGLQDPTAGSYTLFGQENSSADIESARRRIGAIIESPAVFHDLSAEANMRAQTMLLGTGGSNQIAELLDAVGLSSASSRKVRHYSLGMRQRLGIAKALLGSPDLLILDEPANGLDPQGIVEVRELIMRLNRERHITFLISSHILDELSRIATQFCFIDEGRIIEEISARALSEKCARACLIDVPDARAVPPVLDGLRVPYEIVSRTQVRIFGDVALTPLVLALHERGIIVRDFVKTSETLETYYMRMTGGSGK